MLATSNEIIGAWLNHSRQLSIRVKIDSVTYGSEEITSLSFDSGSISGEVFQIGSTYMNSVQIVFPSIIESIAEDIEVIPELGVMVNGSYEYTKLGHFYVDDFDRNKNNNTTSITATDKMRFMEGEYVSKLTYPKAYREVALDVANSAGVEVNRNSFASLGIGAINKPEGYTHRQAIGLIAQFEGGFASFNRNGELEIRRLAPTTFEITPESYLLKGFTKNESSYRIGGISVKTGEEETDVIRVGSTNGSQVELENKVMTQTLLNQMWELVKTLNYFPYELKWRGCPPLEAGDWIYVSDKDGNKYSVPNLSYSITFNGGMSSESKALTSSTSQATYKYKGSLNQRIDYLDSVLSANKWNTNYYGSETPENPKEGDIWFKPNGQDTEIWVYKNIDGVLKWVMEISSAGDPDLLQAIEDAKKAGQDAQLAADGAKTAADDAKQVGEAAKVAGAEAKAAAEQAGKDAQAVGEAARLAANDAKQAGENAIALANQADIDAKAAKAKADAIQIDVNGVMSDVASINANVTAINTKANDAYAKANAVEGRTSTLETSVTGLTSRMTDVESTSTSTTKKLNELVVTVDGQTQTLATTTNTANSALNKANVLENSVDGVKTTLSSVESTVSNIGAQGTNLLINGGFENDLFGWTGDSVHKIDTVDKHSGIKALMIDASDSIKMLNLNVRIPVYQGQQLEFSMWYKTTSDFNGTSGNNKFRIGKQDGSLLASYGWDGALTEWTNRVATLTVGSGISELTLRIDSIHSVGKVWWDDITITDVTNRNQTNIKVNQITETVDGHTQLIASTTSTANSALTKATNVETTVNGLKTTVSSVETTANSALTKATSVEQTANGLTTTVTNIQSDISDITNRFPDPKFTIQSPKPTIESSSINIAYDSNGLVINNTGTSKGRVYWGTAPASLTVGKVYYVKAYLNTGGAGGTVEIGSSGGENLIATPPAGTATWIEGVIKATNYSAFSVYVEGQKAVRLRELYIYEAHTDVTGSQITQLSDQMNFKLTSSDGGVTQIDMQNKIVTIASENIYLTGKSYISDAIIKTAHIVDLAVSNGKIANLAVTEGKIANLAVTNAKIANLSVTEGKIGDAAITNAKIGNLAVSEAKIASLAVSEGKIANLAVTETKIGDAAITNAKIGNLAVSTAKIADAAITDAKIGNLSATKITTGTLNAANVNIINLNASNITTGTISGANLSINLATGSVLFSKGKIANSSGTFSLDIDNDEYYSQGYVNGASSEKAMTVLKSGTLRTAFELNKTTGQITTMLVLGNNALRSYVPKSSSGTLNPLSEVYDTNNQKTIDFNFGATSDSDKTRYGFVSLELYKVSNGGTNSLSGMPYMQIHGQNQAITLSAQSKIELNTWSTITLDAKRTDINSGGDATSYGGLSLGNDSSGGRVWSIAIYNRTYAAGNGDICITSAGTLGRKTSARKYKADIKTADDVIAHAKEFLTIQPASWYDKKDYLNGIAEDRFYGFIADEFHEKGLTEVVYYGDKGQVEGLAYDRLTMYQNVVLNEHEQEIQRLKQEVSNLKTKVEELEAA